MGFYRVVPVCAFLLLPAALPAAAQDAPATVEELWAIVQQQQVEIDELKRQLGETRDEVAGTGEKVSETAARLDATGDYLESIDAGTGPLAGLSIGGYGELHYNNLDADDAASDVDMIDFHRFVLFVGH